MSDETVKKTYLINFQDNLDAYAQHAADAKEEVDKLTVANEELKKSGASPAEIEKSNAALRNAQQEYKNATKEVILATKAKQAEKGSYEELYRQWQLAQTQLKLMKNAYTTNSEGVRILSQDYIEQSKKVEAAKRSLDAFGKGIADNRLNVGNYSEAIDKAVSGLQGMPGPLGQAASGVKALGKQFLALLANPIVLLIAAITAALVGLFKAFKSTDSGAVELEARMNQLKAVFDVIRQRAVALIGALGSLFKGDFKKAGEQFKETFTGIGQQIGEATKAAYEYAKAIDDLEDSEANFISRAADINNEIAKLEYSANDRKKSTEERKKALQEALELSKELSETNKKYAEERFRTEVDNLAGINSLRAEDLISFIRMTDEEQAQSSEALRTARNNNEAKFKQLEELYAKSIEADTRFYEENKRNASKYSGFILELEKEQKEAREAARVERLRKEAETATEEMRNLLNRITTENRSRLEAQVTSKKTEEDLSKEFEARRLERIRLEAEASDELMKTTVYGRLDLERQALEEEYTLKISAAQRVQADTTEIEETYARARAEISRIETDAKLAAAQGLASDISSLVGEQSALGKAAAVAATLIDTYRGAQAAFTGMTSTIPGPAGIAAGVAAAALAVALGLANVKKILAVKTPKGGGGGGAQGGGAVTTAATRVTARPVGPTELQPTTSAASVQAQQRNTELTADAIAQAMSKIPPPVVTVEDINAKTSETKKVEVRATV